MSQKRAEERRKQRELKKMSSYDLTRQKGSTYLLYKNMQDNCTFTITKKQLQEILNREIMENRKQLLKENAIDIFKVFAYSCLEEYKIGASMVRKIYKRFVKESDAIATGHVTTTDMDKVLEEHDLHIK